MRMPINEMLDEMLDQPVKCIQHSVQHLKTKFVFDLDQTSSNINLQMFDDPTWVVKRKQHSIQNWRLIGIYDPKLGSASTRPPVLGSFAPGSPFTCNLLRNTKLFFQTVQKGYTKVLKRSDVSFHELSNAV